MNELNESEHNNDEIKKNMLEFISDLLDRGYHDYAIHEFSLLVRFLKGEIK
jgi:hypothetical protein